MTTRTAPAPESFETFAIRTAVDRVLMQLPRVRWADGLEGGDDVGIVLDVSPSRMYGHVAIVKWSNGNVDKDVPMSYLVRA